MSADAGDVQAATALSLREALALNRTTGDSGLTIGLVCGFTPLHLQAFVPAYVHQRRPDTTVQVRTGTYGDLVIAAGDLSDGDLDATVVFIEWADLDPRLSVRRAGTPASAEDVVGTAQSRLRLLRSRLLALAERAPLVVVPPQLAFPTYFPTRAGQQSSAELAVRAELAGLLAALAGSANVRVSGAVPDIAGDVQMLFKADFPYSTVEASTIAREAVTLLFPPPPKKGLVTDLDDTLWRGLVGETGPDGVTWDLDHDSHVHALYQQLLARLAERGVLIAVASKNDQHVVDEALARPDLRVPKDSLFPVIATWNPKSDSIARILRTWNIGAGDVVMVDDNGLELAQISERFPTITTRKFEPHDPVATIALIGEIDALFARDGERTAEDALRSQSLKAGAEFAERGEQTDDYTSFLADIDAELVITFGEAHTLPRAYELVQKTNQFNLNGRRHELAQWTALGQRPESVSLTVRYQDKFGELGVISVLSGMHDGERMIVESWVLSCRAFSRAVEHHTLRSLFDHERFSEIVLDYAPTDRNGPFQSFLATVGHGLHAGQVSIDRKRIETEPLALLHRVTVGDRT